MKSEQKDQAAKLRELALLEQESSDKSDSNAVGVLDREPEGVERVVPESTVQKKSESTLSRKKRKRNQKKQNLKNGINTTDHHSNKDSKGESEVLIPTVVSENKGKQDQKEGNQSEERITMDLPVYSQKDAAKAILPSSKKNDGPAKNKEVKKTSLDEVKPEVGTKGTDVKVPVTKVETKRVETITPPTRFNFNNNTQVIAITGGKGGVGKSNIACNLGISFSRMGKNVLLMDADLSLANIDVLLGMTPKYNISHVISGEKEINEVVIPGPGGMKILPGGSGVEELAHLSPESMSRLFQAFDKLQPVPDVFLLDTAAGIHPNVLQFVFAADQVIVVTTPEPTAYVDAYALIKTVVNHEPEKEIGLLINMAKDSREALHVTRLLLQLCRTALKTGFNNLGFIPKDEEVSRSVRNQTPFIIKSPNCHAAKSLKNIASTIMQIEPNMEPGQGISGFFRRMFAFRQPNKKAAGS